MFDATDLEITRREHNYEMGRETKGERAWTRFYNEARDRVIAHGWDGKFDNGKFDNGKSRGLDGNEYVDGGDPSDGYSIDGAYEAFEKGWSVDRYIGHVREKRAQLGL